MRILSIMLLLLGVLSGCGRKGALFLLPSAPSAQTVPDQPEPKKQP